MQSVEKLPEDFPIQSLLIANRGEIALRIIRACKDMGIRSIAVYSFADRGSLYVREADDAICIGEPQASQSYLNIPKLIAAAQQTGASAIHPGYGFLSENPDFAQACADANIIFVGPPAHIQRLLGEKTSARNVALQAHAPIPPGVNHDIADAAEAKRLADSIGYPVLLKAASGGGGKGIRFVYRPEDLEDALRLARSEAKAAFNDERVYLEKAIKPARHIEVQIFGDAYGNVAHLGERECSLQRRNQKLVEETPSAVLSDALRNEITAAAVNIAKHAGYVSAGTVEFLLDNEKNFYFMEVNTRLQVEHPVTELRTGIDLVKEQIRVAGGLPLSFRQEDIHFSGHAIECRITAEDSLNKFLPSAGFVQEVHEPQGPGVRVDSGLFRGAEVSLYYDSLLAKLIVWGANRDEAITRMKRALQEYSIIGLKTTIPFAIYIMEHPRFIAADLSTGFIAETWDVDAEKIKNGAEILSDPSYVGLTHSQAMAALAAIEMMTGSHGVSNTEETAPAQSVSRWKSTGLGWRRSI